MFTQSYHKQEEVHSNYFTRSFVHLLKSGSESSSESCNFCNVFYEDGGLMER